MLEKGALLFKFVTSNQPTNDDGDFQQHVVWFKQMQELGFLVSATTGCFLPYENFSTSSKGRPKGHKIAARFFCIGGHSKPPTFESHPHGWPVDTQVSHLCHRKNCINPSHLVYEPQWKNLKRNYCGENGKCDCGVMPKCIVTYHSDQWWEEREEEDNDDDNKQQFVTYHTPNYKRIVSNFIPGYRFSILPQDHYRSVDIKRQQRNDNIKARSKGRKRATTITTIFFFKQEDQSR